MKRITAVILALALVLALVPTVFALGAPTYEYVFTPAAMSTVTRASSDICIYSSIADTVSDPWRFVAVKSANNSTAYNDGFLWNWNCGNPVDAPTAGGALLALEVRVGAAGDYAPSLSYTPIPYGVKADIYLVPKPAEEIATIDDVEAFYGSALGFTTSGVDKTADLLGTVDFYGAATTEKTVALSEKHLAAGDYVLLFVPNGMNENVTPLEAGTKRYLGLQAKSLVLDSTEVASIALGSDKASIRAGETAQLSVAVVRESGKSVPGALGVAFASSAPQIASVNAYGVVTANGAGTVQLTASVGGMTSAATTVQVVPSAANTYTYVMTKSALLDKTLTGNVGDTTKFNDYSLIDTAVSSQWAYYGCSGASGYTLRTSAIISQFSKSYMDTRRAWEMIKLNVGKAGIYDLKVTVNASGDLGVTSANVFFLKSSELIKAPNNTVMNARDNLSDYIHLDDTPVAGTMSFATSQEVNVARIVADAPGDYIVLFEMTGPATDTSFANPQMNFSSIKLAATATAIDSAAVYVDKTTLEIDETARGYASAKTTQGDFADMTGATVTYASSTPDIAEVNESTGVITAKAAGTANITASVEIGGVTKVSPAVAVTVNPAAPVNPNPEITTEERDVIITAANSAGTGVAVDITTSLTSYTQGNAQTNDVGTVVTATAPTEVAGLKFRYWINEGAKRVVETNATVEFALGTNTKLTAVYAAEESGTLVEFFNKNGEVLSSTYYEPDAEITYPTLPTLTGYGTAIGWSSDIENAPTYNINIVAEYDEPLADIAIEVTGGSGSGTYAYNKPVRVVAAATSGAQVFSHWEKNGKLASYDADYTFYAWGAATLTAVYADEAPTEIPSVFIDSVTKNGAVMAEFVGFAPDTIIEKGIFFGAGTPSITSYSEKALATGSGTQFTAKPNAAGLTARAYAIYRDGATVRVAYSD